MGVLKGWRMMEEEERLIREEGRCISPASVLVHPCCPTQGRLSCMQHVPCLSPALFSCLVGRRTDGGCLQWWKLVPRTATRPPSEHHQQGHISVVHDESAMCIRAFDHTVEERRFSLVLPSRKMRAGEPAAEMQIRMQLGPSLPAVGRFLLTFEFPSISSIAAEFFSRAATPHQPPTLGSHPLNSSFPCFERDCMWPRLRHRQLCPRKTVLGRERKRVRHP